MAVPLYLLILNLAKIVIKAFRLATATYQISTRPRDFSAYQTMYDTLMILVLLLILLYHTLL